MDDGSGRKRGDRRVGMMKQAGLLGCDTEDPENVHIGSHNTTGIPPATQLNNMMSEG